MCSQVWWCQFQFLATSPCASEIGLYSTVKVTECINLVVHWWCVVHGNLGLISRLFWCSLCITYKWGACWKLILPSAATHSCQVTYFLTDIAHVELVWVVFGIVLLSAMVESSLWESTRNSELLVSQLCSLCTSNDLTGSGLAFKVAVWVAAAFIA